jgi:hypothetical protein
MVQKWILPAGLVIVILFGVFKDQIMSLFANITKGGQTIATAGTTLGGFAGTVGATPLYALGAGIDTFTQGINYFGQQLQKLLALPSLTVGSTVKCYDINRNVVPCP